MLPAYFGLFAAVAIGGSRPQYLSAFTIGIFLWFFSDTIGDSSYLGVNIGLSGGIAHLALVVFFALALVSLFVVEGRVTKTHSISYPGVVSSSSFAIPFLVAIALSIHGIGEGVAFGGAALSTSSTSLIAAFGR